MKKATAGGCAAGRPTDQSCGSGSIRMTGAGREAKATAGESRDEAMAIGAAAAGL